MTRPQMPRATVLEMSQGGHPGTFWEAGRAPCGGACGASEIAFLVDLGTRTAAVSSGGFSTTAKCLCHQP